MLRVRTSADAAELCETEISGKGRMVDGLCEQNTWRYISTDVLLPVKANAGLSNIESS